MIKNAQPLTIKFFVLGLILFSGCGNSGVNGQPIKNPLVEAPSDNPNLTLPGFKIDERPFEQARGGYASQGSLVAADRLELVTSSLLKIFVPRQRSYGSLDLVTLLENSSRRLHDFFPSSERLQVGDTSNIYGGQAGGHSSHQNGLDADLVYFRKDGREMLPDSSATGKTGFDEKFVIANRITKNFDVARNWKWISILESTQRVERIFVDPVIKATLCQYAKDQNVFEISTEVLRMLRPWPLHDDHMHVRITCPASSPNCIAQSPPPRGHGCIEAMAEVAEAESQIIGEPVIFGSDRPHPLQRVFPMMQEMEEELKNHHPALIRSLESKVDEVGC
jgi:penicillin-insensitive murein endopeptidase